MIYDFVFSVELVEMPDCKTANAVKLTTNVFRDINIAFISELSLMFEKLGIDTMKVLDAAKKKYNFQPHFPGPGVGKDNNIISHSGTAFERSLVATSFF